jgi:hypothetical protein
MSGQFWGRIGDSRGPLLVGAFIFFLTGYSGIGILFDVGLGEARELSQLRLVQLVMCSLFTGTSGNAGMLSAINATAKSFPDPICKIYQPLPCLSMLKTHPARHRPWCRHVRVRTLCILLFLSLMHSFREMHPMFYSCSHWPRPCLWSLGFSLYGQFHFPYTVSPPSRQGPRPTICHCLRQLTQITLRAQRNYFFSQKKRKRTPTIPYRCTPHDRALCRTRWNHRHHQAS